MTQQTLYESGWEHFPWWWILEENLLMFTSWIIGFAMMWPLQASGIPVASLGYLFFILVTVGWLLRLHNCSTCVYYNKWCHTGWGKYTALFCQRDAGRQEIGQKLVIVYMILPLIPIVGAVAVGWSHGFSWGLIVATIIFIGLNGIQFAVRPKACAHCKQRNTCPGSAKTTKADGNIE